MCGGGLRRNPTLTLAAIASVTILMWTFISYNGKESRWYHGQGVKTIVIGQNSEVPSQSSNEDEEAFLASMEATYEARRQIISSACKEYSDALSSQREIGSRILYDVKHKLGSCTQAKAGSSTWFDHFLQLSDLPAEEKMSLRGNPHELHKVIPEALKIEGQDSDYFDVNAFAKEHNILMFAIIRHPFDRIISAYDNKVERWEGRNGRRDGYKKLRATLAEEYGGVSFPNFVKYILGEASELGCPEEPLNCWDMDSHWRPYFVRCNYCEVHYDVIGTTETFYEDTKYIAIKTNLTSIISGDEKLNSYASSDQDGLDRIAENFNDLEPKLRQELYNLYKIDFDMFGYDAESYLT